MPSFSRCAAVFLGLQFLCPLASAVVFTVDPGQSTVVVKVVPLTGCSECSNTDTLAFSGTITASAPLSEDPTEGTVVGSMRIGFADLALTDGTWLALAGPGIIFTIDTVGVADGTMMSPLTAGLPVAPQTSELELQGSVLTFTEGVMTVFAENAVDLTFPLGDDPMSFSFDSSSVATATLTEINPDLYGIEVTIPISIETFYVEAFMIEMDGMIVMTGVIPKPPPVPSLSNTGVLAVVVLLMASSIAILVRTPRVTESC